MIVDLFWICVVILGSGWLYFYVARPILEAYNIVGPLESVNGLGVEESTPKPVMSNPETAKPAVPVHRVPVPVPGTPLDTAWIAANLTEDQLFEVIALARNRQGKSLYSGKRIYSMVGGNHGVFLAKLRRLRGGDLSEDDDDMLTPIAGRPTRAAYYESDPALQYQEPPK
jgi:hypothetical protein